MSKRIYVIDTSVLIANPDVLLKLNDCKIIIPMAAIWELDRFKKLSDIQDPRAKAARKVTRILDSLGSEQDISTGARTPKGSIVVIYRTYAAINGLASCADNKIVGTAVKLKKNSEAEVIVLSNDGNMRNVSRAYGIMAMAYPFFTTSFCVATDRRFRDGSTQDRNASVHSKQNVLSSQRFVLVLIVAIIFLFLLINVR